MSRLLASMPMPFYAGFGGPLTTMKNDRRVVISGLGVVAPNGIGKTTFWDALAAGKSGVDWIKSFDTSKYPCRVAAEVHDFEPADFMNVRRSSSWGRFSKLAV